jgi:hypothetical protein
MILDLACRLPWVVTRKLICGSTGWFVGRREILLNPGPVVAGLRTFVEVE